MAKFYQVGGSVRDELLGRKSKDIDYSVEAESFDHMREAILSRGGQIFMETPEYFTIRAKVPGLGACDYVLCRKDGEYTDGRRPDSVEMGSIYDDLARRDFTMNAIAKTEKGAYIDPFNGRKDIHNCYIRCVGGVERLREDGLRMLRAVRFSVTLNFYIDAKISNFIEENASDILNVSVERIREELYKMFAADTVRALYMLQNLAVRNKVNLAMLIFGHTNIKLLPTTKQF